MLQFEACPHCNGTGVTLGEAHVPKKKWNIILPIICVNCYAILNENETQPTTPSGECELLVRLAEYATKAGKNSSINDMGIAIDTIVPSMPTLHKSLKYVSQTVEKQVIYYQFFSK